MIVDNHSGAILFMGRVNRPREDSLALWFRQFGENLLYALVSLLSFFHDIHPSLPFVLLFLLPAVILRKLYRRFKIKHHSTRTFLRK
jgi:hypothetical protein